MKVSDATAIVTGGAAGLGLATARTLLADGAHVVLVDLPSSEGSRAAAELGNRASFAPADVSDPEQVRSAVDHAGSVGPPLRVVVNCAGLGRPTPSIGHPGPDELAAFAHSVAVNLTGTYNVVRIAAQRMLAAPEIDGERGVIVNTGSTAALDGPKHMAGYVAAKAGVVGLTLTLARDFAAARIRVVTIAPASFGTAMYADLPDRGRAMLEAAQLHPARVGDPAEFAALVRHIVENPMLNGETIRLDGGARVTAG
jgi:NAD(P)-dependent dehydrogenase (short-subunit alcohol dehydrogenase family)